MNALAVTAAPANAARFIDNGDGTITEPARGLMWTKDTLNTKEVNHAEAERLCATLIRGYDDWRLPTVEELFGLADRSQREPAIDTDAFPDTQSDWYWSSTISAWSSGCAWVVYFSNGSPTAATAATASGSCGRSGPCRPVSNLAFLRS